MSRARAERQIFGSDEKVRVKNLKQVAQKQYKKQAQK